MATREQINRAFEYIGFIHGLSLCVKDDSDMLCESIILLNQTLHEIFDTEAPVEHRITAHIDVTLPTPPETIQSKPVILPTQPDNPPSGLLKEPHAEKVPLLQCPGCGEPSLTGKNCKYCVAEISVKKRKEKEALSGPPEKPQARGIPEMVTTEKPVFKDPAPENDTAQPAHKENSHVDAGADSGNDKSYRTPETATNEEEKTDIDAGDDGWPVPQKPASEEKQGNETLYERIHKLKREGATLGRVQQVINAQSQTERAQISLIYMGKVA